jgi:hypothetical protein
MLFYTYKSVTKGCYLVQHKGIVSELIFPRVSHIDQDLDKSNVEIGFFSMLKVLYQTPLYVIL